MGTTVSAEDMQVNKILSLSSQSTHASRNTTQIWWNAFRECALTCSSIGKWLSSFSSCRTALPRWWVQRDDLHHLFLSIRAAGVISEGHRGTSPTPQEGISLSKRVADSLLLHFNLYEGHYRETCKLMTKEFHLVPERSEK